MLALSEKLFLVFLVVLQTFFLFTNCIPNVNKKDNSDRLQREAIERAREQERLRQQAEWDARQARESRADFERRAEAARAERARRREERNRNVVLSLSRSFKGQSKFIFVRALALLVNGKRRVTEMVVEVGVSCLGIRDDLSLFPTGSILKLTVKNFVTYDCCTLFPGPYMNMIIGPNGTGKSSIICAIAIGLGNAPSLLGRMREVGAYVKHGQEKGYIEITLKTASPPFHRTIRRVLRSASNTTDWFLDGEKVSARTITDFVNSFGIQVDNLCQFLPQEKVSDFSKLDGVELLKETIKASLPFSVSDSFNDLKELKKRSQLLSVQSENLRLEIDSLLQQNEAIRGQIDRIKERERKEKQVHLFMIKLLWLRYDVARTEYLEAKSDRDRLKVLLQESSASIIPMESQLKSCIERIPVEKSSGSSHAQFSLHSNFNSVSSISSLKAQLLSFIRERSDWHKQSTQLRAEIREMEEKIRNDTPPEEPAWIQPKLDELSSALDSFQEEKFVLEREKRQIEFSGDSIRQQIDFLSKALSAIEDKKSQRLERLRKESPDSFTACEWITRNISIFQKPVHLPVCITVDMREGSDFSGEFEELLSFQTLTLIVCECDEDFELLQVELLDKLKLKVNIHVQKSPLSSYTPKVPPEQLKRFGFDGYLIDYVEGPEIVKASLCHLNQIHWLPVSKSPINEDALFKNTKDILRFCADGLVWNVYLEGDGSRITRTKRISSAKILALSLDSSRKESIESQLDSVRREREGNQRRLHEILTSLQRLRQQEDSISNEKSKVVAEKRSILTKIQQFSMLADKKRVLEGKLESLTQKLSSSASSSQREKINQLKQLIKESFSPGDDLDWLSSKLSTSSLSASFLPILTEAFYSKKVFLLSVKIKEFNQKNADLMRCLENAESLSLTLKQKARSLLEEINSQDITASNLNEEQQVLLNEASDSIDELQNQIVALKTHLEILQSDTDDRIVAEYQSRQSKIQTLQSTLSTSDTDKVTLSDQMKRSEEMFLSHLNPVISTLCDRFSTFFQRIGCVGQVKLSRPEPDATDYDNWRLDILVKFRDKSPLAPLAFNRQSGGERSVATFLYMMAMQGLSLAPFRVVDEINQGMDARNEAKMHEVMIDCTTAASNASSIASQYFLVTPKLLSGLKYNSKVTVLCVFNGRVQKENESESEFDLMSFL